MKAVFASLLLIMLLALSCLAFTGAALQNGELSGLLSGSSSSNYRLQANPASAVQTEQKPDLAANQAAPAQQNGVVDARTAVRQAGPAVVTVVNNLAAQTNGRLNRGVAPQAMGSGMIIDRQGYIVTNNHVVQGEQSLQVIFSDGKKAPASLVGADSFSDIAVIKVDVSVPAVAQFGDSDKLELGQPVVAIGSALAQFENTVTAGVVSGLHRDIEDNGAPTEPSMHNLIQTDAAINHGNSGGPLLDLSGNVIGINVAVVRTADMSGDVAEGLGFAIPASTAQQVAQQLIKSGSVERPYLGISYQPITPQIASYYNLPRNSGILVQDVAAGSPADKAGIQAKSIVTKFDGTQLDDQHSLLELLLKHKVGDSVKLTVVPDGSTTEKEVTVVLGTRPNGQ